MKHVAILLDGKIKNDGRVRHTIESLSDWHKVDLYCVGSENDYQSLFNKNVKVIHYKMNLNWININLRMDKKFKGLRKSYLKNKNNYDFIWVNDYPLLSTGVFLKAKTGGRLIYDSHEIYIETINQFFPQKGWKALYGKPLISFNRCFHSRMEKKHLKYVDQMITVCDSLKIHFESIYPINNVMVIKNCPKNVKTFENKNLIRQFLKIDSRHKILLYQGDVNLSRGINKIAEAMKYVDENIHFVIIGDGTKLIEYKNKYQSANIHFMGKVDFNELYSYTASANVGISIIEPYNLSKKYSLPNKVFEYMSAGIPIITNNLPEASKIIKEANCGFVIDDSTSKSIAKAINEIFLKEDLAKFGQRGFNAVVNKYNWETETKKMLEYIEKQTLNSILSK